MSAIFINYRRNDSAAATGRIDDRLRATFGRGAVYRDIDNIPAGSEFVEHIESALSQCRAVLVIIGKDWVSPRLFEPNDFVRLEIETALKHRLPIIPVLIDEARMPEPAELPTSLAPLLRRNGLHVESGRDFAVHVARLIDCLRDVVTSNDIPSHGGPATRASFASQASGRKWIAIGCAVLAVGLTVVARYVTLEFRGSGATASPEGIASPSPDAEQRPEMDVPSAELEEDDLRSLLNENMEQMRTSSVVHRWKSQNRPAVTVLPLKNETSERIDGALEASIGDIESKLVEWGGVRVISLENQEDLQAQIRRQYVDGFDQSNITYWAQQIGARYFVTGKVYATEERLGPQPRSQYYLFMQVLETTTGEILFQNKASVVKLAGSRGVPKRTRSGGVPALIPSVAEAKYGGPMLSTDVTRGGESFEQFCGNCHPNGEEGKGPSLPSHPTTPAQIRYVVREGIGSMRAIPRDVLSSSDLEDIMAWMAAIAAVK